ncbi:MAG: YicC family protein [Alistipes sp.]|nr:YicC family protein [Bacteroidaceae bacterium]MBO7242920.1 YicC family protein [Alistipes sp.]
MTGFGKGEAVVGDKKFRVELRSLNSKQLDLSIKIPSKYRAAEAEVRSIVTRELQRGKVDCFVSFEAAVAETSAHINREAFKAYAEELRQVSAEGGLTISDDALLRSVLRMPDVVTNEEREVSDDELKAILEAATIAAEELNKFRVQEGAILIADLLKRIDLIEKYRHEVEPYEGARVDVIKTRIRENIEKLQLEVDNNRLEQEMIFYIEKLDITEEKVRLDNHCNYFREVAREEEAPGRKLGFIAQELGREINTMGSKSNEANMQRLVVKMKDELEKIKEQVLNIL